MSFAFRAAGSGEALMTSTHTSFEAARAAARLPAAALLQIPSTLLLVLAGSVGSRAMINLQSCAYSFTPEASAGVSGPAGVVAVVVGAGLLGAAVAVVAGVLAVVAGVLAAAAVVAGVLVAVELLVAEPPPLLPQAARSAEHSSATTSGAVRLSIIDSPLVCEALASGL
jgi:hypothetical protein